MPFVNPLVHAMGEVTTGWTGTITITVGATPAAYTVKARESALSAIYYAMVEASRVHGTGWTVYADASSQLTLAFSGGAFSIAVTGTAEARLGLSGTLSGSAGYTFGSAYASPLYPARGLALDNVEVLTDGSQPMSDGALARPSWRVGSEVTLSVYDSIANCMAHQALLDEGGTWDVLITRASASPTTARLRVLSTWREALMGLGSEWGVHARCMAVRR